MGTKLFVRSFFRIALPVTLFWAAISAVGALANYSDALRRGANADYLDILLAWWQGSVPLVLMTGIGSAVYSRWPQWAAKPKNISVSFGVMLLVLFPLVQLYQATLSIFETNKVLSATTLWTQLQQMPKFFWFTDFVLMAGTLLTLLFITNNRQRRLRDHALQQAETDNLKLRLALEQQRMDSLRAQLEPHFLFNALNAIAALMRAADLNTSITALQRLSELLRYAINAGKHDWVSVADEVRFIDDYLALQKLRYGSRLQVRFEGVQDALDTVDCPPLLLQPLVENALRHDLDCHDGTSDLLIHFKLGEQQWDFTISNPLNDHRPLNPGFGLGLSTIKERLQGLYGKQADFATEIVQGRFTVRMRLPRYGRQ